MKDFFEELPLAIKKHLSTEEENYLRKVFNLYSGYPTLNQLWYLMDKEWLSLRCDPDVIDERVYHFYSHPVWLLNGLFIEQHQESIRNRKMFVDIIRNYSPSRIADFGGGFGGLGRMVGNSLPSVEVDIIEPYPRPSALAITASIPNVDYRKELTGVYDLIIATDVFEHVKDPVSLVYETSKHLKEGGVYLIANCFEPVIKCHLPQHYHFKKTWGLVMSEMGFVPSQKFLYAQTFFKVGQLSLDNAQKVERVSKKSYFYTNILPSNLANILVGLRLSKYK